MNSIGGMCVGDVKKNYCLQCDFDLYKNSVECLQLSEKFYLTNDTQYCELSKNHKINVNYFICIEI